MLLRLKNLQMSFYRDLQIIISVWLSFSIQIHTQKRVIRPFITSFIMESSAFFIATLIACLLLSITSYSLYVGFGPPSQELRDPFEEHED